jgi:hypothetical protein
MFGLAQKITTLFWPLDWKHQPNLKLDVLLTEEQLDKLGHLLLAGKLDVLLTENNQKSVSLSVVGDFRINCSF